MSVMRWLKYFLLMSWIVLSSIVTAGCWNYRESDKMSIVAGLAIDKGTNQRYKLTAEVIQITGGSNAKISSQTISMEGKTLFDTARNAIAFLGEKMYMNHSKVLIVSKDIAKEGLVSALDGYVRDSDTRFDVGLLISKADTAAEIFNGMGTSDNVVSFVLSDMLKNEKNLSKTPVVDLVKFYNEIEGKGIETAVPTVELKKSAGKKVPTILGTAIFKGDKLTGFLKGNESESLLFIKNELKNGVLPVKIKGEKSHVSLEIYKNKTKITPIIKGNDVKMVMKIETETAIDEINGTKNFNEGKQLKRLKKNAERVLENQIISLIQRVQSEYGTDIFGFGAKIYQEDPESWKKISKNWDEGFKNVDVIVEADIHIRNSALLSKPIKDGR